MGKLFKKPKVDNSARIAAEQKAAEAEAKAKADELQAKMDEEYRRKKQRGKASTILSDDDKNRSLLGG